MQRDTPEPTQIITSTPEQTALPGFTSVTVSTDWEPVIRIFDGVEMALVPAGCFPMGSDAYSREQPIHEVCFEEPFWIDIYEVTNAAYGSVGCRIDSSEPDQPRNCVTWVEALAYCESRGARLPTEAEWEYAARGPDGLTYPWGNEFVSDYAVWNVSQPEVVGSCPEGVSWVGAFDLSGNLWEWVNDWYDAAYYRTLTEIVINPQGPEAGEYRVLRGGSWNSDTANSLRGAERSRTYPDYEHNYDGFRCARSYLP